MYFCLNIVFFSCLGIHVVSTFTETSSPKNPTWQRRYRYVQWFCRLIVYVAKLMLKASRSSIQIRDKRNEKCVKRFSSFSSLKNTQKNSTTHILYSSHCFTLLLKLSIKFAFYIMISFYANCYNNKSSLSKISSS